VIAARVVFVAVLAALPLRAQTPLAPLLPRERELALARSAAPLELSGAASVYVLQRGGHVKAIEGTNGAACLVARDHPDSFYPICYDPEAARTIMAVEIERQRLRERGVPEDSIEPRIAEGFRSGALQTPKHMAIAYMMSREQVIYAGANGRRVGSWFPHLMIYVPYMTKAQLAISGLASGDLTLDDEGKPTAHFVVMARDWAAAPPAAPTPTLSAQPGWLCPGDSYVIRWNGPPGTRVLRAGASVVDGQTFVASAETVLSALNTENQTIATDTVSLHPDRMEHNLVRPAASCAGRLSLTSMAIPPASASDRIRPRSVTNRGKDAVHITHRGVTIRLAPGESTEAFNNVSFSGDWGVIVDTGAYNAFCPLPPGAPAGPPIDVLIVTGCAS
jgi:hypothetical protein